jgi:hypothetical protein
MSRHRRAGHDSRRARRGWGEARESEDRHQGAARRERLRCIARCGTGTGSDPCRCCLVGHPGCYTKFGFENIPGCVLEGVPREVLFALSFEGYTPRGTVAFHEGFKADGEQTGAGDPPKRSRLMLSERPLDPNRMEASGSRPSASGVPPAVTGHDRTGASFSASDEISRDNSSTLSLRARPASRSRSRCIRTVDEAAATVTGRARRACR